jgi:endonuclease YncB( thermonuclease family)
MVTKTILCLLGLLLLATYTLAQDVIRGRCVAVSDGDTIKVLVTGRELLRIRVAWIDAPEMGQPFGRRAKQFMSALVFGKDVELHPHAIDRYGRTVAMVFVDGRDVGLELIKAGLAWAYEITCLKQVPRSKPCIAPRKLPLAFRAEVSGWMVTLLCRPGSGEEKNTSSSYRWDLNHEP